jgi:glycosyltransferase involved in cell wall biosynthesis
MSIKKISIVTFPIGEAGVIPLRNLVRIMTAANAELYLVTGNAALNAFSNNENVHVIGVRHNLGSNLLTKILNYSNTQFKILLDVIKISKKIKIYVFFIDGSFLTPSILALKLLRKKVILALPSSVFQDIGVFTIPAAFISRISIMLSDQIVVYSESLITEYKISKYKAKISIAHEHFLDFDKFKSKNPVQDRDSVVGYVGRFSEEKGITNFSKAIPEILKEQDGIHFLIGGGGLLQDEITSYIKQEQLNNRVTFTGWVQDEDIIAVLNQLKLLVVPSYTEGLPNIMLEAMACGTPVLITPVGAIPGIIKDGETGFIMENNSPEVITRNVIRALNHPDLQQVANNARKYVEQEFTFEKAMQGYQTIFSIFICDNLQQQDIERV